MPPAKNQPLITRFLFAWAGLTHGVRAEHSLKVHVASFVLVLIVLAVLRPEPLWWALVVLASALVIAAEMFNTAIEALADHLHPDVHPSIRIVKDCAAGAVLVASLAALAVAAALIVHLWLKH